MSHIKFDPKQVEKLNNPGRLEIQNPDLIWDTLALNDPKVLVDVGAGTGFFAMPFADKIPEGIVYACDTSEVMLDWMKDNLPEKYQDRIIRIKTEENTIDLADGVADLVYMMLLHHELENPLLLLQEAKRLLKPGGKLMIVDWKKEVMPFGPPLEYRVDTDTIESHMQQAGFRDIVRHDSLPLNSFLVATV